MDGAPAEEIENVPDMAITVAVILEQSQATPLDGELAPLDGK